MLEQLLYYLTLLAALGCGLIAGVFFAFSSFVMGALERIAPALGIAAMQSINIVVINRSFLGVFFGTAVACAVLIVFALATPMPGVYGVIAGGALYLIGTVLVTVVCNVPRNNALAEVEPQSAEDTELWSRYVVEWTRWNHVRTLAALLAAAAFSLAL